MIFCLPLSDITGLEVNVFDDQVEVSTVWEDGGNEQKDTLVLTPDEFDRFIELLNQIKPVKDFVEKSFELEAACE